MSAYVIADVEITDANLYGQFLEQVTATVEAHGGKFVARGDAMETILGNWTPKHLALLEFGNLQQIHAWLASLSSPRSMTFAPGPPPSTW